MLISKILYVMVDDNNKELSKLSLCHIINIILRNDFHALFSISYHVPLIKYRNQNWELIQNCNFDKIKFEDVHCVM